MQKKNNWRKNRREKKKKQKEIRQTINDFLINDAAFVVAATACVYRSTQSGLIDCTDGDGDGDRDCDSFQNIYTRACVVVDHGIGFENVAPKQVKFAGGVQCKAIFDNW